MGRGLFSRLSLIKPYFQSSSSSSSSSSPSLFTSLSKNSTTQVVCNLLLHLQASRSYAQRNPNYNLFRGAKPGGDKIKKSSVWTSSDDESEKREGVRTGLSMEDEIKEMERFIKEEKEVPAESDDSDEVRHLLSMSEDEWGVYTGSEADDDTPAEPYPNNANDKYIDKLFEYEETSRYKSLAEALKDVDEPEEMTPGKQARKLAVENALKKLKKGPDGRYTNVWEVMSDIDILIGAFENIVSGPEYQDLRQAGPKKLNMPFFKDIQAKMRDPNYKFATEIKLKPKSRFIRRKKWEKTQARRKKAQGLEEDSS